ncbi:MAG: hypothetical protein AABZ12_14150 [Planctomycetota bacterium]|mgnify:CR=1 FL=1
MRNYLYARAMKAIQLTACGAILLQAGGCSLAAINETLQTVLLGVTAAGAVAIIQNI